MKNKTRLVASALIQKVSQGLHLQAAMPQMANVSAMASLDRQLCSDLAYGYFRYKLRLDFILSHFLKKPGGVPEPVLLLLKTGLYSLLFQERVPDFAAIHDTVEQSKSLYKGRFSALVNALLRSVQRNRADLLSFDWYRKKCQGNASAQAVWYSVPESIIVFLKRFYDRDTVEAILKKNLERPWSSIRLNPKAPHYGMCRQVLSELCAGQYCHEAAKNCFVFAPGKLPSSIAGQDLACLQKEGAIFFQSAASLLMLENLGLYDWQEPIFDCCAGAGGKTLALLENNVQVALAGEISPQKAIELQKRLMTLGYGKTRAIAGDAGAGYVGQWSGNILLDAPCSGLGTLSRRPDLKYNKYIGRLDSDYFTNIQKGLLGKMAALLLPGKALAYITCSINPLENELLIEKFISNNRNFKLQREWKSPAAHPWLDGMYGAVLEKR